MSEHNTAQTLSFKAEEKQLLHLVTHSLYSNKEIFLRELISNASDAADKLRYEALSNPALYENDGELKIWIEVDKNSRTVTIRDNGIGMSRQDAIEHLGTIAKSGTKAFRELLSADKAKESQLIGQFGVGFYSAFVVADRVVVRSRRAGLPAAEGVYWESNGEAEFKVQAIEKPMRGTEVILYLKKDEDEFLESFRLRQIIRKYSDHVPLPIVMFKETEKKSADDKSTEVIIEEEVVNRANALWTLPKSEIKDEDYCELYKHLAHDFENPLAWTHNRVEGKLEYISLLYLPAHAPFDLWQRDGRRGIKLYVKRVFILEDAEHLMPLYLRFVRGVIDSNDLPLNVSREILQSNKVIEQIKAASTKRILSLLEELAENEAEKYQKFWKEFGVVLKEGPAEDAANRERIAKLLRFASTQTNQEEQTVTLADYVKRMPEKQKKIYYIIADTFNAAKNSPLLEVFRKNNIEVLLLSERVDEWLVSHLTEFEGKSFQSIAKGDLDLAELGIEDKAEKEAEKTQEAEFADLLKQFKEKLGERVKEVRITNRLTDSPACVVFDDHDLSGHMQRILAAAGQDFAKTKPIFEINPKHPLVLKAKTDLNTERLAKWSEVLFNQALLAEGEPLENPAEFVKTLNELLI